METTAERVDVVMLLQISSLKLTETASSPTMKSHQFSIGWKVGKKSGVTPLVGVEGSTITWNTRIDVGRLWMSSSRTVPSAAVTFSLYTEEDNTVGTAQLDLTFRRKAKVSLTLPCGTLNVVYAMKCDDLDDGSRSGKHTTASTVAHGKNDDDEKELPQCIFCNERFDKSDPEQEQCRAHKLPLTIRWNKVVTWTAIGALVGGTVGAVAGGIKVLAAGAVKTTVGKYAAVGLVPGAAAPGTAIATGLLYDPFYRYECCGAPEDEDECDMYSPHVDIETARLIIEKNKAEEKGEQKKAEGRRKSKS